MKLCLHLNRFCPIECGADQSVHAGGSIFGDVFFCEVSGGNYGAVGICCLYLFHCSPVRQAAAGKTEWHLRRQTNSGEPFLRKWFPQRLSFHRSGFSAGDTVPENVQTAHAGDMGFIDQTVSDKPMRCGITPPATTALVTSAFVPGKCARAAVREMAGGNFLYPIEHVSGFGGNAGTVGKQGPTDLPRTVQVTDAALCGEEQLAGSDLCAGGGGNRRWKVPAWKECGNLLGAAEHAGLAGVERQRARLVPDVQPQCGQIQIRVSCWIRASSSLSGI